MNKLAQLKNLRKKLDEGENIISVLTDNHSIPTSAEDEMISYDMRAGVDLEKYNIDPSIRNRVVSKIASYIEYTGITTGKIVECGSGEGMNLSLLTMKKRMGFSWARGFDISWSRNKIAQRFSYNHSRRDMDIDFAIGDFFNLPLKDSSIDMLFTMQGIYAMGGREVEILKEFKRVTKEYLVIIEPTYEMADETSKKRMDSLGYVKNIAGAARSIGLEVVRQELLGADQNPLNPAAAIILKKCDTSHDNKEYDSESALCCPITRTTLKKIGQVYYSEESMLSYPIINGVASLLDTSAVVTTKLKYYV